MAEPAIGGNNLIGFDNSGGNNTSTNYSAPGTSTTPPTQIPTYNIDVNATSIPIDTSALSNVFENAEVSQIRSDVDSEGTELYIRISNFQKDGEIVISGKYNENFQTFPKYDLSRVKVLDDINFKFILLLKNKRDSYDVASSPFYTSRLFFDELIQSYQDNIPYLVNASIKQEKIVVVYLEDIKERISELHIRELSTFLSKQPTIVIKNLFEFSNYGPPPEYELNSTYDLDSLVRYIDWVVTKPNQNYDERLLAPNVIGEWIQPPLEEELQTEAVDTTPSDDEPSPNINNQENQYPPVGRVGAYTSEIVSVNDELYIWSGYMWLPFDFGEDGPPGYD
jgi:hypothetical protein